MPSGPLPTIERLAREIQEIVKTYPTTASAQGDPKKHSKSLADQIAAARKMIEHAAQIQMEVSNLLDFTERYLTP